MDGPWEWICDCYTYYTGYLSTTWLYMLYTDQPMLGLLETNPMNIGAYDELPWKPTRKDQ